MMRSPGILNRDMVLGFSSDAPLREHVFRTALGRDAEPSFMIEADFMNQKALNDALGNTRGNRMMVVAAFYLRQALSEEKPSYLYTYRQNSGDEISVIVGGLDKRQVERAIKRTDAYLSTLTEAAGLSSLRHARREGLSGVRLVTAFERIRAEQPDFHEIHNSLQQEISQRKDAMRPGADAKSLRSAESYHNRESERRFDRVAGFAEAAINKGETVPELPAGLPPIPVVMGPPRAQDMVIGNLLTREQRNADIDAVAKGRAHSILRFDLYNLGGLNSLIGPDHADIVKNHMMSVVIEECRKSPLDIRLYHASAGVIDALAGTRGEQEICALKHAIRQRIHDEILSVPVDRYAAGRGFAAAEQGLVGHVPYKGEERDGVGLIMCHAAIGHTDRNAVLAKVDSLRALQKMHGASFIEKLPNSMLRVHSLFPDRQGAMTSYDTPDADYAVKDGFPYANSLKDWLGVRQIIEVMRRPCGQIMQLLFGLDTGRILTNQRTFEKMLADGVDENEAGDLLQIRAKASLAPRPPEQDDEDFYVFNMLERPDTKVRDNADHLTVSLAKRLGAAVPPRLDRIADLTLEVQSALRTLKILEWQATGCDDRTNLGILQQDIRTHMTRDTNGRVRLMQAAEQSLRVSMHAGEYLRIPVPAEVKDAAETLARNCLSAAAAAFSSLGENHIGHVLQTFSIESSEHTAVKVRNLPGVVASGPVLSPEHVLAAHLRALEAGMAAKAAQKDFEAAGGGQAGRSPEREDVPAAILRLAAFLGAVPPAPAAGIKPPFHPSAPFPS